MNRASETYGIITKGLTFVSLESQKEKSMEVKSIQKNNGFKLPKLGKGISLQNQEAEQNSNRINLKKSISRHIIIKLLKTKDKEKTETTHYL